MATHPKYEIADFNSITPVDCPCGQAKRAFTTSRIFPGTLHVTTISNEAKLHYHERLTETYFILECEDGGSMELDGNLVHVHPGMSIVIPPGVRHRAVGVMKVLIIVLPKFDPTDEIVVEE